MNGTANPANPISELFSTQQFMPHGHCFLWKPELLWVHVVSDTLIAAAYASIPAALIYFVLKRKDLQFEWIFILFGIFILTCGGTHLMAIYTTWEPSYYLSGLVKLVCAAASVGTAIALWPMIPKLLALPSPTQLRTANASLAIEIEEHHEARERLAEQTEQLREANAKLRESNQHLDEFTSVVAHDLQEPVRKIISYGELLADTYGEEIPDPVRDKLQRMVNASARMQQLINDLLSYARMTSRDLQFEPVAIGKVVEEVAENLDARIQASGGEIRMTTPMPTIDADQTCMWQLFQNIVGNGLKFHRENVPPIVEVSAERLPGKDDAAPVCWKFTVSDNGIGIPEEYRERIFETFMRLHGRSKFEGTGIGLSVCKNVVERHGGRIEVDSVGNEGTIISIILPETQAKRKKKLLA